MTDEKVLVHTKRTRPAKKKEKRKLTYEELIELKRKAGKASARKRAEKGRRTQHRQAVERRREREKELLAKKKAKQKENAKIKKEKEKLKAREKAKRKRKYAKKLSKKMMGNTLGRRRFFIYESHNGKIDAKLGLVGKYTTYEKASLVIEKLKEGNEKVIFERRFNLVNKMARKSRDEYIVVQRKFPDEDTVLSNSFFRNEYGRYVEHKLNKGEDLYIIDKFERRIEDTFWVFGYDHHTDRKTFLWIYENLFLDGFESIYDMKRVFLYHNRILILNDAGKAELIMCKCCADAIRFYNLMQGYCKSKKFIFMGNVTAKSALRPMVEASIMEKTGWSIEKINKFPS